MNILSAKKISKTYPHIEGNVKIFTNISLELKYGQSLAIIGESGRGKTTLLYLLCGLESADSGKIIFEGQNIVTLSEKELGKIRGENMGFIFQHHFLLNDLNALENTLLPLRITNKLTKESLEKTVYLFEELHIENRLYHSPDELSGGEKQRVAVIRALVNNPRIIFADEPTGSLDKKNAEELQELLFNIIQKENTTLILSTHNQEFANSCNFIRSIDSLEEQL